MMSRESSLSQLIENVKDLHAGQKYRIVITARNEKGSSLPVHLVISSPTDEGAVYQPHDGPSEAEVRDGGKNGSGADNSEVPSSNTQSELTETNNFSKFMPILLGTGGGLLVVSLLLTLGLVLRIRKSSGRRRELSSTSLGPTPRVAMKSPILSPKHTSASPCTEREMQVESESDADPDVIPLQESYHNPGAGSTAALPATLLPPDQYRYVTPSVSKAHLILDRQQMNPHSTQLSTSPSVVISPAPKSDRGETEGGAIIGRGKRGRGEGAGGCVVADTGNTQVPSNCGILPGGQLDPSHQISSGVPASIYYTLPRGTRRGSSNVSTSQGPLTVDPHQHPFQGIEGSLPPAVTLHNPRATKRTSHSQISSPSGYEEDEQTTPLLNKRESSV
ncbi:hypothetical protein SK128_023704 [Halocaridina rubra]|uniref:Uncharacterized protein n=1 Tax=Halocaridina rubra TaxID=373956 RepID=A0AAN8XLJ1_HALRR